MVTLCATGLHIAPFIHTITALTAPIVPGLMRCPSLPSRRYAVIFADGCNTPGTDIPVCPAGIFPCPSMVVQLSRLPHAVPLRLRVFRTASMLGKCALCRPASMSGKDNGALFSLRPGLFTGSRCTPRPNRFELRGIGTSRDSGRSARFEGLLTACAVARGFVGVDNSITLEYRPTERKASLAS